MTEETGEVQATDACLEVRSQDLAFRSMHFYATLYPEGGQGGPVAVMRTLTNRDAGILNKIHGCRSTDLGAYREGQEYEGFDSISQAVEAAVAQWETLVPSAQRLVRVRHHCLDEHQGVLAVRQKGGAAS